MAAKTRNQHPRAKSQGIYDPSQMLQGRSLKRAARSLTNIETKPAISQLARQIANTNRQAAAAQNRVGGFYNQFGQQAQQALQQQGQIANQTNQALQGIASQTQTQIGQYGQGAQDRLAPLQQKGLDGGAFARLATELAAQQSNAAQNAQTYRSFGATQGGNYQGLTAGMNATGQVQATDDLHQLANAFAQQNADTRAKKADLISQRGELMAKNVGALRDSERNYQLAVGTLGLNQQKLAADVADNAARRRLIRRQQNITARGQDLQAQARQDAQFLDRASFIGKYGISPERLSAMPPDQAARWWNRQQRSQGSGGLTHTQAQAAFADIDGATRVVKQLTDQGWGTGAIRNALANGYYTVKGKDASGNPVTKNFSVASVKNKVLVNAAMDLAINGYLSQANIDALHRYGLTIGNRYKTRKPIAYRRNG